MTSGRAISRFRLPKTSFLRGLLLAVGLAIFAGLSWQIGLQKILFYLQPLGWKFVLIFLPYLLVFFFDTVGWRYALKRGRHRHPLLSRARQTRRDAFRGRKEQG